MSDKFEPDFAWQEPTAVNDGPAPSSISHRQQPTTAFATVPSKVVALAQLTPKTGFLIFNVEDQTLALEINSVEKVCPAVEITPLPQAPGTIVGLVNVHGSIVVVLNLRKKLGTVEREIDLSDQLVIASADDRQFALLVDEVTEVRTVLPEQIIAITDEHGETKLLHLDDKQIPIFSLANVLSSEEEEQLNEALYLAFLES